MIVRPHLNAHRLLVAVVATAHAFVACSSAESTCKEEPGSAASPLINGQDAGPADYAAVVKGVVSGKSCTLSRVGDKLLLTAAHCFTALSSGGNIVLSRGASEPKWSATFEVKSITRHPSYTGSSSTALAEFDVAVIELAKSLGNDVETSAVDTTPSFVGENLTMVGYGCNDFEDDAGLGAGIRRFGTGVVATLYPGMLRLNGPSYVCPGDSGGPGLRQGSTNKIAGIISSGDFEADGGPTRSNLTRLELVDGWLRSLGVNVSSSPPDAAVDAAKDAPTDTSFLVPLDAPADHETDASPIGAIDATVTQPIEAGPPKCIDGSLVR